MAEKNLIIDFIDYYAGVGLGEDFEVVEPKRLGNRSNYYRKKLNDVTSKYYTVLEEESNTKYSESGIHSNNVFWQSLHIASQKLLKKFPLDNRLKSGTDVKTLPGPIGMLINGVEIENYKSTDTIFYGPVDNFSVLSKGENYDVINLPALVLLTILSRSK